MINQRATMHVVRNEDLSPQLRLTTLDEVSSLLFEHRVLVGDRDELIITETFGICNVRQIRIARLAEFTNNERFIDLKEPSV